MVEMSHRPAPSASFIGAPVENISGSIRKPRASSSLFSMTYFTGRLVIRGMTATRSVGSSPSGSEGAEVPEESGVPVPPPPVPPVPPHPARSETRRHNSSAILVTFFIESYPFFCSLIITEAGYIRIKSPLPCRTAQ